MEAQKLGASIDDWRRNVHYKHIGRLQGVILVPRGGIQAPRAAATENETV